MTESKQQTGNVEIKVNDRKTAWQKGGSIMLERGAPCDGGAGLHLDGSDSYSNLDVPHVNFNS